MVVTWQPQPLDVLAWFEDGAPSGSFPASSVLRPPDGAPPVPELRPPLVAIAPPSLVVPPLAEPPLEGPPEPDVAPPADEPASGKLASPQVGVFVSSTPAGRTP